MRNLHDVIEKMIQAIPQDFKLLIFQLQGIQYSLDRIAPEMMESRWEKTYDVLETYVYNAKIEGWREDVRKVFTNE